MLTYKGFGWGTLAKHMAMADFDVNFTCLSTESMSLQQTCLMLVHGCVQLCPLYSLLQHGTSMLTMFVMSQGSIAVFYNWLKIGGDPHTWVTDMIKAYALPVNFVGLSTEDRRFIYPQKEVRTNA